MIYADLSQMVEAGVSAEGEGGSGFDVVNGLIIPVVVDLDEWANDPLPYVAGEQYSPSAADSRAVARIVLGALNAYLASQEED